MPTPFALLLNQWSWILFVLVVFGLPNGAFGDPLRLNDDIPGNVVDLPSGADRTFYGDFSIRAGQERYQQDLNTLVPLSLSEDRNELVFTTLNFNYRDRGNNTFSGGLGYRFYLPGANVVWGFHLHGDVTETAADNSIGQFGFGFDFFTDRGIALHGNFYLPESERYIADPLAGFGDLFATGNSVFQNFFIIEERGRRGGDLKVAFDVLFLNEQIPTRGFIGAYHYNGTWSDNLTGAMAGISFEPFEGARLGAEYYGDDEFFGGHWVFVAGVSAPLEFENILKPSEWGRSIGRAFRRNPGDQRSHMREKLFERVDRRQWVLDEQSPALRNPTPLLIADSIIFVNSGGTQNVPQAQGIGNGTFENPSNTIQRGVNLAASRFGNEGKMLIAGGQTYSPDLIRVTERGLSVFGNRIDGFGGRSFLYGSRPVINGGFFVAGVNNFLLANTTLMNGFSVAAGNAVGLVDEDDTLYIENVQEVQIIANTFLDASDSAIDLNLGGTASSIVSIVRNRIAGTITGNGINVELLGGTRAQVSILDNTLQGVANDGVSFQATDNSRGTLFFEGNTIADSGDEGMDLDASSNADLTATIRGNTVNRSNGDAIRLNLDDDATASFLVSDNVIRIAGDDGLLLDTDDRSRLTFRFLRNSITGVIDDAWDIQIADDTTFNGIFSGDLSRGLGDKGIEFNTDDNSVSTVRVSGNIFEDAGDDSISIDLDDDSRIVAEFTGNSLLGAVGSGFQIEIQDRANFEAFLSQNTSTGSQIRALSYFQSDESTGFVRIVDNQLTSRVLNEAMAFFLVEDAAASFQIARNNIEGDPIALAIESTDNVAIRAQVVENDAIGDINLFRDGASTFQYEDSLGTNVITGGGLLNVDPGTVAVPVGTFNFPALD